MWRRWGLASVLGACAACGGAVGGQDSTLDGGVWSTGGVAGSGGSVGGSGGTPSAGGVSAAGGVPSTGGAGGSSACALPKPGEIDGEYFLTLAWAIDPTKPVVFAVKVTTESFAGQLGMRWVLRGLRWSDRKTVVGDPIAPTQAPMKPFMIDVTGNLHAEPDAFVVQGESNPLSHTAVTIDIALVGSICGTSGFFCGTFTGSIVKPIPLDLAGSTWTLERIFGGVFPEPPAIDCAKNLAAPVGSFS